jgi:hypothetical protein
MRRAESPTFSIIPIVTAPVNRTWTEVSSRNGRYTAADSPYDKEPFFAKKYHAAIPTVE